MYIILKKSSILGLLLTVGTLFATTSLLPWIYVDFDESMEITKFPHSIEKTKGKVHIDGSELLDFFRVMYEQNNPSQVAPQSEVKIPKIIHQIWLGSKVPEAFKQYMASWVAYHCDGWQYKLWTDEDIKSFELYNQDIYDADPNYGVKSDLWRYEILYRYGGVYIDTDFECLRALDFLHYTYDFYIGLQPLDSDLVQVGSGIFGSKPGHPLLKHIIETIKDEDQNSCIPSKTGPIHVTRSFFAAAGKEGTVDIAFPASYFYPLGSKETMLDSEMWLAKGAFAVHHWAKSWLPPSWRKAEFKTLKG